MKIRVLAAAVLLPLLLIVVLALPKLITALLFGVMAAIAAWELLKGTGMVRHPRLPIYAMVSAFLVSVWSHLGTPGAWGALWILILLAALFGEMMLSQGKLRFEKVCLTLAAGLLIPYLFTSLVRLHSMEGVGRFYILLPFVIAFLSDSCAYFAGRALGRHKLAPVISPNKTVEGLIGGVVGAVAGVLLYGLILDLAFGFTVQYGYALIYGLVGSLGSVFGDLSFSVIKRQTGIKDYGNLIPGHGGILDRFDSMMVVGPLAEVLIMLIPMAVKV